MLVWLPVTSLVVLLAIAALVDLRERRIPNWLTGGVALLYPVYLIVSPTSQAWLGALAVAAAVFLVGLVLFARNMLGGGDVKLIAAVSLWAGPDHLALFTLVTSLAGGCLALASLWYRRWHGVIEAHMAGFGWKPLPAGRARQIQTAPTAGPDGIASTVAENAEFALPYGIAIAAGGLAVVAQLITR